MSEESTETTDVEASTDEPQADATDLGDDPDGDNTDAE